MATQMRRSCGGGKTTEEGERRILDRGQLKAVKTCLQCNRDFTWRKKWERCWNEVTTCSDRCKTDRKRALKREGKEEAAGDSDDHANDTTGQDTLQQEGEAKENERPTKENERTAKKEIKTCAGAKHRSKQCNVCQDDVELAYRVRYDESRAWRFVCRPCWPKVSGQGYLEVGQMLRGRETASDTAEIENVSLPPTEQANPFYQYGGTWKATIGETKNEIEKRAKKKKSSRGACDSVDDL